MSPIRRSSERHRDRERRKEGRRGGERREEQRWTPPYSWAAAEAAPLSLEIENNTIKL